MREIPLTKGKVTIVDDDDYDSLSMFKWQARTNPTSRTHYAARPLRRQGKRFDIFMHRVIANAQSGEEVDRKNGDGLDNRRANLRVVTAAQNRFNVPKYRNNKSGYKGVYFRSHNGRWSAQITTNKHKYHLGYYGTAEEAARAYDKAAREQHGEFARPNFE